MRWLLGRLVGEFCDHDNGVPVVTWLVRWASSYRNIAEAKFWLFCSPRQAPAPSNLGTRTKWQRAATRPSETVTPTLATERPAYALPTHPGRTPTLEALPTVPGGFANRPAGSSANDLCRMCFRVRAISPERS